METEILVVLLILISISFLGYLYYQQLQNKKVDNFEVVKQEEIIEEEQGIDWNGAQHIGWLYKNGTNKNFDNLILYFNQNDATFFGIAHKFSGFDVNKKVFLDDKSMNDGKDIKISGMDYKVVLYKEED